MDEALAQIDTYAYDKTFYSARFLAKLSKLSGRPLQEVTKYITGFLVAFLLISRHAHVLCNLLLIIIPGLMTHIYKDERPNRDNLLVYWACFSILTLFDRFFDPFRPYYIFKMCLLATLFIRPLRFVNPIKQFLFSFSQFSVSASDVSAMSLRK